MALEGIERAEAKVGWSQPALITYMYRTKIIVVWWLKGAKTNAPEMQAMPQVMIGEDLHSFDNNAVRIDLSHVFPNLSLDGLIFTYLFSSLPYCTLVTKSKK